MIAFRRRLWRRMPMPSRALNILPFNFEHQFFGAALDIQFKGIDYENLVENLQSRFIEPLLLQNHAHAGKGEKVARLQFRDMSDVIHGAICIAAKKPYRRALIPGFGPIGFQRDEFIQQGERQRILARLRGSHGSLHQKICGVRKRLEPKVLYGFSDVLRVLGIAGFLQPLRSASIISLRTASGAGFGARAFFSSSLFSSSLLAALEFCAGPLGGASGLSSGGPSGLLGGRSSFPKPPSVFLFPGNAQSSLKSKREKGCDGEGKGTFPPVNSPGRLSRVPEPSGRP